MKHSGKLKRNISAKKNLIGSDIHLINIPTAMATGGFDVLLLQDVDQEVVSFNADEVERLEPYMEAASNDLKILKSGKWIIHPMRCWVMMMTGSLTQQR